METNETKRPKSRFLLPPEKDAEVRELGRKVNEAEGITGPPTVTAEELKERMERKGLRAEDRIFQRELMRMRYGDDEGK